jgi:ADP-ribose pyrophosphatase YjhB (NUDIX family)
MSLDDHHKHFQGYIAQKVVIEKDGKILLVQYPKSGTAWDGFWDLPGGRLNDFETALEGVKREVEEEIGVEVNIHEILATGVNRVRDDFKLFWVIYRASLIDSEKLFKPELGEISAIEWKDKKEFFTTLPVIYNGYRNALERYFKSGKDA